MVARTCAHITICAIVRDEATNPAGGVVRFVESTAPYVGRIIIADTGSKDDTTALLQHAQERHQNLEILTLAFTDYASARNTVLEHVPAGRHVLVLDADEIVTGPSGSIAEGFRRLEQFMNENSAPAHNFWMHQYFGIERDKESLLVDRLFIQQESMRHTNTKGIGKERILIDGVWRRDLPSTITIPEQIARLIHFRPERVAATLKNKTIYAGLAQGLAPSEIAGAQEWKQYSPARERFS